jgi:type II secretory pathway pseudopilin PulG
MYCATCGTANPESARFCLNCGTTLLAATVVVNPRAVLATPAPPPAQASPAVLPPAPPPGAAGATPQTSGKAVTSLVLSLANGLFLFCFFPLAIAAVVFGHLSRAEIKKSNGRIGGAGVALAGLIIGYLSLAIIPLIVGAIAIPNLLMARSAAGESAAIGSVRVLTTAAVTYEATYAKGFPPSLQAMGSASGQPPSENAAGLIDDVLASGRKGGFIYTYTPGETSESGIITTYTIHADPIAPDSDSRHFFTDETGVIRSQRGFPATAQSPPLE